MIIWWYDIDTLLIASSNDSVAGKKAVSKLAYLESVIGWRGSVISKAGGLVE